MSNSNENIENEVKETRIAILPNGKMQISHQDAVDLFKEYMAEYWRTTILTNGLSGNRQALNAKFSLYQQYVSFEGKKDESIFVLMAKKKGYRMEAIQELWSDFNEIYQPEFVQFLKNKINPPKEKENNGMLEF